ncbi:MAG: AMP-binding protein, partial [Dehalococcoidia bacterium]
MNLKEMLEKTAGEIPQKEAIILGSERVTYGELDECSNRAANVLIGLGLERGDHVAILMSHNPDWVINYFGIIKAGGVAVLLGSMLKAPELAPLLRDSDAKILITEKSFSQMLSRVLPDIPLLKHVIESDGDSYNNMMANSPSTPLVVDIRDEHEVSIIYTSGALG